MAKEFTTGCLALFFLSLCACAYVKSDQALPAILVELNDGDLQKLQQDLAKNIGASQLILSKNIFTQISSLTIERNTKANVLLKQRSITPGNENIFMFTLWKKDGRCIVKSEQKDVFWQLKHSSCKAF